MPVKQTAAVSLDIGHSNLKIIQTASDGRIVKFVVHKMPEGCIEDLNVVYDDALVKSLKGAKKIAHQSGGKCTLVISGSDIITRHFTLPVLPEEELYQNILNEMSGYLPVSPEKYNIDYKIAELIKEEGIDMYKVLVCTANKRMVSRFKKVLSMAGLKLNIIDTCENAREKLLKYNHAYDESFSIEDGICILDFGSKSTRASVYHNGNYYVSNIIKRSGQTITEAVAKSTGKDIIAAEALKREINLLTASHTDSELKSAVAYEVDSLLLEINRVFDYYRTRSKAPIRRIYISGGGALLPGLQEYMEEYFGIPVHPAGELFLASKTSAPGLSFLLNAYAATLREELP